MWWITKVRTIVYKWPSLWCFCRWSLQNRERTHRRMWNSVQLMDGSGKWSSFDRSPPQPLIDEDPAEESTTTRFRSWDFKSHQQTNYADWSNGQEDDAEDLFAVGGPRAANNYPSAAELFRNFVGKLLYNMAARFCLRLFLLLRSTAGYFFFLFSF